MSRASLATIACISFALLSTACGNNATGGAPSHGDAWLSAKYKSTGGYYSPCGTYAQCPELEPGQPTGNTEVDAYYQMIGAGGATGARLTFATWLQQFMWPGVGNDVNARYGNALDLQLGRDMHCWQAQNTLNGPVTACYVSNYGPAPFDSVNQVENPMWPNLEEAVDEAIESQPLPSIMPFATVAMVYSATGIGTNKDHVTFYVFDQNGNLLDNAALDGEGPKSVPRMCMACHGGIYLTSTHSVTAASGGYTASFLPFDVWGFYYSQTLPKHGPKDQQEAFRQLNNLVLGTNPNPAIADLINGLYSNNVAIPGTTIPDDSYVPSGWSANPTLYKGVFRKYCRMCHLAQDSPTDFSTLDKFGVLLNEPTYVCGNQATAPMPHAEVPFGGLAGSTKFSSLNVGFWWDFSAISDMNSFLDSGGFNPFPCVQP